MPSLEPCPARLMRREFAGDGSGEAGEVARGSSVGKVQYD